MNYKKLYPLNYKSDFKKELEKQFLLKDIHEEDIIILSSSKNKYKIYSVCYLTGNTEAIAYHLCVNDKYNEKLDIYSIKDLRKRNSLIKKMLGMIFYLKNKKYIGKDEEVLTINIV